MHVLPLPAWFFVGVESLAFAADMVQQDDPKIVVPKGSISCILTLLIMSIWVLFVCSSLPPGVQVVANELIPLNAGFSLMFNCSKQCVTLLSLPATFATAYGFVFSFGKLLHALATSKLLPEIFSRTAQPQATPFTAIILGSSISYTICLLVFFFPRTQKYLFNICITDAFVSYCAQCIGFLFLRTKFSRLPRLFNSPVGSFGALYSFFIFLFGIISVVGFQEDNHIAVISALFIWATFSVYYFVYAKHRQTFSAEEQKILLVAHVINHNRRGVAQRKANAKKRGNGLSPAHKKKTTSNADSSLRQSLDISRPSLTASWDKWMNFVHCPKVLLDFVASSIYKPSSSAILINVKGKSKAQASRNLAEEKISGVEAQ